MRLPMIAFAAVIASLIAGPAQADNFSIRGNDTGGIIAWSPSADDGYGEAAVQHCARYNKVAHITLLARDYGEFFVFECLFDRNFDPNKAPADR